MSLFDNNKVFDYPKPTSLIYRLLKYGFLRKQDIILDFFSGSGTTAHAAYLYSLNENQDIKFILIQLPEDLDRNLASASNDAKKTIRFSIKMLDEIGKPHLITEIAKERIRRAGRKVKEEAGIMAQDLDIGFRVLKLDSSNMEDVYYTPDNFDAKNLFTLADNIKTDRTSEDLLFQVMLDLGIELSAKIEKTEIAGKEVWCVDGGYLMACFDRDVNEATITEIAKQKPVYFVIPAPPTTTSSTTSTNSLPTTHPTQLAKSCNDLWLLTNKIKYQYASLMTKRCVLHGTMTATAGCSQWLTL